MVVVFDCDCFGVSNLFIFDVLICVLCMDNGYYCVVGMFIDCVYLVLVGLFEEELYIVVFGINNLVNLGDDVIYFGIVLVVMEGCFFGLLVIVVLLVSKDYCGEYYEFVVWVVVMLMEWLLVDLLLVDIILNVNVFDLLWEQICGFEVVWLGKCYCVEVCIVQIDLCGCLMWWIGLVGDVEDDGFGIDFYVVCCGYVLVMLIYVDFICYQVLEKVSGWMQVMIDVIDDQVV